MPNLDLKFYFAIFLRRLPYFLVIVAFLSAIGITVASILPPVYRSSASMLVEPQQIPDQLAQATVPVNPFEQAQIIEQRLMTRANLLALAERIGLYAGEQMSAGAIVGDMRKRIEFIGFVPDVTRQPAVPGATIIGVAFEAPSGAYALKGANELVSLVLEENVKLRTDRAGDTLSFFKTDVDRLAAAIEAQSQRIAEFKTQNVEALPDSLVTRRAQQQREQERLLELEREEAALRNQRSTVTWVFERTGRSSTLGVNPSPEELELQALQSQLIQQRAIYAPSSPRIKVLETRLKALQDLVDGQRDARAVPDAEGNPAAPASELDIELAPIDARLEFIAQEKALIEKTLADFNASIQATPSNEMVLGGLEREMASLQQQYDTANAALIQAQTGERIEVTSQGQRFSLIEPPTEPGSPVRPKRMLIAGAGVVGGIGAGVGFILLMELLNRSIRRPVDLSAGLGIQPFATVPYIRTRGERRWKRGAVTAVLALILVAIPAGLFALHTYYLPLDLLWSETWDATGLGGLFEAAPGPVPAETPPADPT